MSNFLIAPSRWRRCGNAVLVASFLALSTAAAQEAPPPSTKPQSAAPALPKLEPPDGKWLVDEQGREYFPFEYSTRYPYIWLDAEPHKKVRLTLGMVMDVLSYDDSKIVVKVYRPEPVIVEPRAAPVDPAKIAAEFANDTVTADRLTFESFGQGLPEKGQWRNGFAVADMNRDGHPDIVHGPPRKAGIQPAIFLGDGKGHFHIWREARYPDLKLDYGDIQVADLNGDRNPDLAIVSHLLGVVAMVGDGKGAFKLWNDGLEFKTEGESAPSFSSRAMLVRDWNRDGRPDILALGDGPQFLMSRATGVEDPGARGEIVYLNQGKGKWTSVRGPVVDDYGDSLAAGDFNADGKLDMATATHVWGSTKILALQQADGTFAPQAFPALRPESSVRAVLARDLDSDGRDDLVVGYVSRQFTTWHGGIDVYYSRPEGWKRRALASWDGQARPHSFATGDVDGDGRVDLAASRSDGAILLYLGDGKGWFVAEEGNELDAEQKGCASFRVVLANLDRQRGDEIVANFAGEEPARIGVPEVDNPRMAESCVSGGAIRAWKARAQSGQPSTGSPR